MRIVIFDCETTGLAEQDVPICIGAVVISIDDNGHGTIIDEWYGEQEPNVLISESAYSVHGRTSSSLAGKFFNFEDLARTVSTCKIAVAHNAIFDSKMIAKVWHGITAFEWRCSYMQWPFPRMIDRKLDTACRYYGVERDTPHDAIADAKALFQILNHKNDRGQSYLELLISQDDYLEASLAARRTLDEIKPTRSLKTESTQPIAYAMHLTKLYLSPLPESIVPIIPIDWYDIDSLNSLDLGTSFRLKLFTPPSAFVNPSRSDDIIALHNDKWIVEINGQSHEWLIDLIKTGCDVRIAIVNKVHGFVNFIVYKHPANII